MRKLFRYFLAFFTIFYGYSYLSYGYNYSFSSYQQPSQKVLDELCIVTGADSNYFDMMVELIQSIKATKTYKNTPICVIDSGLTDEQKKKLLENYQVILKNPGFDFYVKPATPQWMNSITARPYLHKYFPGYRYYLWIDSDTWIHGEWALHNFVNLCVDQGWALCANSIINIFNRHMYGILPLKKLASILFKYPLNHGVFCMDAQSGYFEIWAQMILEYSQPPQGFVYNTEELCGTYLYYKKGLKILFENENYQTNSSGFPIVASDSNILRHPFTFKPIGILHLANNKIARYPMNFRDVPIYVKDKPLNWYEWFINLYKSLKWHKYMPTEKDFQDSNYRRLPIRYVSDTEKT